MVATSAGVSSGSASGVRADIFTASPPGPVLRSCVFLLFLARLVSLPWMSHMVYSNHIAITSGDKSTTRSKVSDSSCPRCPPGTALRCVILSTRNVATGGFGKVIRASLSATKLAAASCPASWRLRAARTPRNQAADLLQVGGRPGGSAVPAVWRRSGPGSRRLWMWIRTDSPFPACQLARSTAALAARPGSACSGRAGQ